MPKNDLMHKANLIENKLKKLLKLELETEDYQSIYMEIGIISAYKNILTVPGELSKEIMTELTESFETIEGFINNIEGE